MVIQPKGTGWLEVICGPMFSGKTEELIRRLRRAEIAKQKVQVFKPVIDDRYAIREVVSHSAQRTGAVPVRSAVEILERTERETDVVGVDEAQFFDRELVGVVDRLATEGRRVLIAGLDTDYRSEPFEPMPTLMARAEYVTKLLAICVRCGNPANRTLRVAGGEARVEVGAADRYEAVCRHCHFELFECLHASQQSQPAPAARPRVVAVGT
jgi:thymidine kinase